MSVCVTLGVSLNVNLKSNNLEQRSFGITLDNIEALANGENPEVSCTLPGSLDCPRSIIKVKYIL